MRNFWATQKLATTNVTNNFARGREASSEREREWELKTALASLVDFDSFELIDTHTKVSHLQKLSARSFLKRRKYKKRQRKNWS